MAWNGEGARDGVFAYDIESRERREERDFELARLNVAPRGVWSDGETAWVSDSGQDRLFAYDLETMTPRPGQDIRLAGLNGHARDIWSDGETMWVLDGGARSVFSYDLRSGDALRSYALDPANDMPHGLWSDGYAIWVSNERSEKLFAYQLQGEELVRFRDGEFTVHTGNGDPRGLWSDGGLMYVADLTDDRVYFTTELPASKDTRLAWLALIGVDIGEFASGRTSYDGVVVDGVIVDARAVRPGATVTVAPGDADGNPDNGHQVAVDKGGEITVTVTSEDGLRSQVYRVRIEDPDPGSEPGPDEASAAGDEQPQDATPEPAPRVVIGNTDGMGVSHRNDCDDGARLSAVGGWPDGTEVEVLGRGVGRCAGWLLVQADDVTSWVREKYVVESTDMAALPEIWLVIGNTGGVGVSHRNECAVDARVSAIGGWPDGTEVKLLAKGSGSCAGWLQVRAGGVTSWVREKYVVESTDMAAPAGDLAGDREHGRRGRLAPQRVRR